MEIEQQYGDMGNRATIWGIEQQYGDMENRTTIWEIEQQYGDTQLTHGSTSRGGYGLNLQSPRPSK
jgi:hypothetical protein